MALDQPTIVPNLTRMRPVEKTAASLMSWLGGGVQPSNGGKLGMFCDASPIWLFLRDSLHTRVRSSPRRPRCVADLAFSSRLGVAEDPAAAAVADSGLHLIEVFPAIALPSIDCAFFGRKLAPRYNPDRRKTFRLEDWRTVTQAVECGFESLGFAHVVALSRGVIGLESPTKADQDRLDALICLLVALRWRLRPRSESLMLGCLERGYMVLPASPQVRAKLAAPARKLGVAIDGVIPA